MLLEVDRTCIGCKRYGGWGCTASATTGACSNDISLYGDIREIAGDAAYVSIGIGMETGISR